MARPAWRIDLSNFSDGYSVQAVYTVPSTGRGYLNLMDANGGYGGYVLHVDFRVKWNKWQIVLFSPISLPMGLGMSMIRKNFRTFASELEQISRSKLKLLLAVLGSLCCC